MPKGAPRYIGPSEGPNLDFEADYHLFEFNILTNEGQIYLAARRDLSNGTLRVEFAQSFLIAMFPFNHLGVWQGTPSLP